MFLLLLMKSQVGTLVGRWIMQPESWQVSGKTKLQLQSINIFHDVLLWKTS